MVSPGVKGLEAKTSWWWITVHTIPIACFVGKSSNGTESLPEELKAENEGPAIPSAVRWLSGGTIVKAHYNEGIIKASSVVLAVKDEETYRLVRRGVLRLQGRRYDTEAYEDIRPNVRCGHCSGWGHIGAQCPRTTTRCSSCAEHETKDHRCPVDGCKVKKGQWCQHTMAKCANCKGPHFA